ncbi:hypothetical protein [Micromonospora echinospora]|nr:hypothetical protein [Micromonospora echinospora]
MSDDMERADPARVTMLYVLHDTQETRTTAVTEYEAGETLEAAATQLVIHLWPFTGRESPDRRRSRRPARSTGRTAA